MVESARREASSVQSRPWPNTLRLTMLTSTTTSSVSSAAAAKTLASKHIAPANRDTASAASPGAGRAVRIAVEDMRRGASAQARPVCLRMEATSSAPTIGWYFVYTGARARA